jgi:hypothetical protein
MVGPALWACSKLEMARPIPKLESEQLAAGKRLVMFYKSFLMKRMFMPAKKCSKMNSARYAG